MITLPRQRTSILQRLPQKLLMPYHAWKTAKRVAASQATRFDFTQFPGDIGRNKQGELLAIVHKFTAEDVASFTPRGTGAYPDQDILHKLTGGQIGNDVIEHNPFLA